MPEQLKPCPFCGKTPEAPVDATRILGAWRVIHRGCCTLPNFSVDRSTQEDAIAAWNRRA
jgi:Lar family restriction alleviation protein